MKSLNEVSSLSVKPKWLFIFLFVFSICSPLFSKGQPPPPVIDGGNPEVPFDSGLNTVFLVLAISFALFITIREISKRLKEYSLSGK